MERLWRFTSGIGGPWILVYFIDADREPLPEMISPIRWDEVKVFFVRESQRIFTG